ncbi:MAG: 2-hydroxyacyl-CoA dehydratase family protein, partial [Syntrophales bacterium LBB04]|nr:2-hydroxyacyl-CoA dehydratase family protein [Syntrophales bacterium LBB04]
MRNSLTPFQDWVDHYPERHRVLAAQRPFIGYFCTYTPVELIWASGFIPVRLLGGPGPFQRAERLVPSFICHYMRRILDKALNGEYAYLTGVVQGYTCDVACGLLNIWQENIPLDFYHTVPLPYNQNSESRIFFREAFQELLEKLNHHGGRFSLDSLERANQLYRGIRRLLLNLYERRYQGQLALSARDFYTIVQAGLVTPPETYLTLLEHLNSEIQSDPPLERKGYRVLVSGSLLDHPEIPDQLEDLGFQVVADDLCTGYRSFYSPFVLESDQEKEPIESLIDHYANHFPCPARSRAKDRFVLLKELMARSGAQGVIFLVKKFCTPHLADYPMLAEAFNGEGLPHILLELED